MHGNTNGADTRRRQVLIFVSLAAVLLFFFGICAGGPERAEKGKEMIPIEFGDDSKPGDSAKQQLQNVAA